MKTEQLDIYPARMQVSAGMFVVHEPERGFLKDQWFTRQLALPVIICAWWSLENDCPQLIGIVSQSFQ